MLVLLILTAGKFTLDVLHPWRTCDLCLKESADGKYEKKNMYLSPTTKKSWDMIRKGWDVPLELRK